MCPMTSFLNLTFCSRTNKTEFEKEQQKSLDSMLLRTDRLEGEVLHKYTFFLT